MYYAGIIKYYILVLYFIIFLLSANQDEAEKREKLENSRFARDHEIFRFSLGFLLSLAVCHIKS